MFSFLNTSQILETESRNTKSVTIEKIEISAFSTQIILPNLVFLYNFFSLASPVGGVC